MRRLTILGLLAVLLGVAGLCPAHGMTWAEFTGPHAPSREIVYRQVGDASLRLLVYQPPQWRPDGRRAALVFIHGGGWTGGTTDLFSPHCAYFAERGAVVCNVEYRLATADGPTLFDCLDDCRAALRYLRVHADTLGIDPQRIAVLGDSSGGHLAACLGLMHPLETATEPPVSAMANAMVLYNPVVDLSSLPWTRNLPGVKPTPADIADATFKETRLRQLSPIFAIAEHAPPCLLIQGTKDVTVPVEQAVRFAGAMAAANNRCELDILPDTRHAFVLLHYGDDATICQVLRRTDEFLTALGYLTGPPTLTRP